MAKSLFLNLSVARYVTAHAQRHRILGVNGVINAAENLANPRETVLQNTCHATLEGVGRYGAARTRPLELDFDDPSLDVGANQYQIAPVGLHGRSHQLQEGVEGL